MRRPFALALGPAAALLLLRAVGGCTTSNTTAGSSDDGAHPPANDASVFSDASAEGADGEGAAASDGAVYPDADGDSGGQGGPTCQLGGTCSETQICTGGIVGCKSNCQCLGGTWRAPCPAEVPRSGSPCTGEGATCGYVTQAAGCGTVGCNCRSGVWTCGQACLTPVDAGPDAGACIPAGGECLFSNAICAVPGPLSCGVNSGSYCCLSSVANCGQPDTTAYACPVPSEGGLTCSSVPIPLGSPNYRALVQATDSDASYPVGCRVTFPVCNNGHVPYCTCKLDQGLVGGDDVVEMPYWSCFYNEGIQ